MTHQCNTCHVRVEVEDKHISPGWMGTNYDEKLVVQVRCPECGGHGKHTRRDDGVTASMGVLAPPEPEQEPEAGV